MKKKYTTPQVKSYKLKIDTLLNTISADPKPINSEDTDPNY